MGEQLKKKAQVSMEFVFLVGLAFTVMVVFISSTRSEFSTLQSQEERSLVKDVGVMIQHELIMASNVGDGYERTFNVPYNLDGISYNIEVINNNLIAYTNDYEYVLNVPYFIGSLEKGNNTISKINNTIYVN